MTVFLIVDTAFFASNLFKVPSGGWFPLVLAAVLILQMIIWRRGRILMDEMESKDQILLKDFIAKVEEDKPHRMPGAGIYLMARRSSFDLDDDEIDETGITPPTLASLYSRLSVLHEQVVVLFVEPRPVPMVAKRSRIRVKQLSNGFWVVKGRYGFGETHNVPRLLKIARPKGLEIDLNTATYFTLRNTIVPVKGGIMGYWRASIFAMMSRNAVSRASYFELPADRIFEVGKLSEL
jgi:KUP system potassium uptake protein